MSFDQGYLVIGGLALVGLLLIILSLIINSHVAHNVRADLRHREKLLEYYRNTFSQLGVILIGIGISLSVFYFQQGYQERSKRNAELQQILSKLALQLARGAADMSSLAEFDDILDAGGPYRFDNPAASPSVARLEGNGLAEQASKIELVEIDVDAHEFELLSLSKLLENSVVVNELDPGLWFNIVRDESDMRYAVAQLAIDYRDLHKALGEAPLSMLAGDPQRAARVREQVLDVYYDADLLRQRARRMLGRMCWFLSNGTGFVQLKPIDAIEQDAPSHAEWVNRAKPVLSRFSVGSQNCFAMLQTKPAP